MKKILAAAMAMAMVLSLAACGNSGDGGNSATSGNNQSNTSSSQAGGSQTTDVSDFKVGAIYINSKNDTAGYTYAHHNGITKAMEALGMDPDTQLIIQDEITEDYENVATAVDTLVGEDCDIIFGISFVLRAFQSVRLVQYAFNGIRAAAAAGMTVFMVPDYNAPTPEIESLCTAVLPSLTELPGAIDLQLTD